MRTPIHRIFPVLFALLVCVVWATPAWAAPPAPLAPPAPATPPGAPATPQPQAPEKSDPNKGRVEALVKLSSRLRPLCEAGESNKLHLTAAGAKAAVTAAAGGTAATKATQDAAKAPQSSGSWAKCREYCTYGTNVASTIDLCSFADSTLARVAVAVAPDEISEILADLESIRKDADLIPAGTVKTDLTSHGQMLKGFSDEVQKFHDGADAAGLQGFGAVLGIDVVKRLLGGLARVIEDRAKREAVGWMLHEVGDNLCGFGLTKDERKTLENLVGSAADEMTDAKLVDAATASDPADPAVVALERRRVINGELSQYWLSNLCALAEEDRLDHYGAGAALLEAVRGAIEADVRAWPGAIAGLALSEAHWAIVKGGADPAVVMCNGATPPSPQCKEVAELRAAGASFMKRLLDRSNPLDATRGLGSAISRTSIRIATTDTNLPGRGYERTKPSYKKDNRYFANEAFGLTGCGLSLPAEITYFTNRFESAAEPEYAALLAGLVRAPACWALVGKEGTTLAIEDPTIKRLPTVLRLHEHLGRPLQGVLVEVEAIDDAVMALYATQINAYPSTREKIAAQWGAGLGLIDASFTLADDVFIAFDRLTAIEAILPGLRRMGSADLSNLLGEGRKLIADLRTTVSILSKLGTGEYGQALSMASRELLDNADSLCTDAKCRKRIDIVVRAVGTMSALLEAENAEQVAEAIDAAANPPGGWRRKLAKGNLTVGLTAYPGGYGGVEWRHGPYGAEYENWGAYVQAPTVALPLGVDVVWGVKNKTALGIFTSLIDPVAFLQYDASNGGQLPGPRPVTVLAPGIYGRVNLGPSPLVLLLGAVYRPQFRTWGATVSGPGADVIQFGVSLAVDVTMWKLYARGK